MPNIQQQKKRVLIATRQRNENLHYRSTIKTLTKRLETAVADGDADLETARRLPGLRGRHILPGAGHWVQQEQPGETNRLLLDFLAKG